jgi:hypothetical protein
MTARRFRCGAPVITRDPRRRFGQCRVFVAVEGEKCYHHRNHRKEQDLGR